MLPPLIVYLLQNEYAVAVHGRDGLWVVVQERVHVDDGDS